MFIDMGDIQLGERGMRFGDKHQPPAVGRPRMPGCSGARVANHWPRLPPIGRHDIELSVRLYRDAGLALGKHNPLSVRGIPWIVVAHSVVAGARKRFGHSP